MITLPARTVAVGTTATNIRKTPSGASDPAALPVTFSEVTPASGGGTVQFVPSSSSVYGDGEGVLTNGVPFEDESQANQRWMCSSTGTVNVLVVDFQA